MDYEEEDALERPKDHGEEVIERSPGIRKSKRAPVELQEPSWTPDQSSKACEKCGAQFTFTKRRHHCRGCGQLLCAKCCDKWLLLPREIYKQEDPQRLCTPCYKKISIIDFSKTEAIGGSESAPPLVLVHDGIYNRTSWHIQMDILSAHFRIYAPDLPGHGSRMDEALTVKSAIDCLKDLVETKIPQKKAIFMGMGFGALMSIVFAAQYPDYVQGVIAAGAFFNNSNAKVYYDLKGTLYKTLSGGTLTGASALEVDPRKNPDLAISVQYLMRAGFHYEAWSAIKQILTKNDFPQCLRNYSGKIWFVTGQLDNRTTEKQFLSAARDGLSRVIIGANHMMYWDPHYYPEIHKYVVEFAQSLQLLPTMDDHMGVEDLSSLLSDDE